MKNVFRNAEGKHHEFSWEGLGDVKAGRENLGELMPVIVYRMMQYSINSALYDRYGAEATDEVFREAGRRAGVEFALHMLPLDEDPDRFVYALQKTLADLKVGILRMEEADFVRGYFTVTVYEDLDCSGLPVSNEVVCTFDEGFIAGILETYAHRPFKVREIDCWASGERVCRFKGVPLSDDSAR